MENLDLRVATLDALRQWSATTRPELVAAAWRAGNRNISELATVARRGRDAIYADLRAQGIEPTTERKEPPVMPTTNTKSVELPVPGWRHPHLLSVRTEASLGHTRYRATTKPFTGHEPRPEIPDEWHGPHPTDGDDVQRHERSWQRHEEIRIVRKVWAHARFKLLVGKALAGESGSYPSRKPAAGQWEAYVAAREALIAAYAALDTTPDGMWRAALLRIVDAKSPAVDAAENWDRVAAEFADLDEWLLKMVGEEDWPVNAVRAAAKEHGVDVSGWLIDAAYNYRPSGWSVTPAVAEINAIVKAGDERIRAVRDLVGE